MGSQTKWIPFDPVPSPAPVGWNDANVWKDCSVTTNIGTITGKLALLDTGTTPPGPVLWSTLLAGIDSPGPDPNWVPQFDGPTIACADGAQCIIAVTFSMPTMRVIKWSGYATAKWIAMGTMGHYVGTGMNYEPSVYPR